jgi:hypothetical protein
MVGGLILVSLRCDMKSIIESIMERMSLHAENNILMELNLSGVSQKEDL